MRLTSIRNPNAFTLIEFLMALALLSILSVIAINSGTGTLNDSRYASTVQKLKRIRKSLVGEKNLKFGQKRSDFGYLGDVGALPTSAQGLAALINNPGVPVAGWAVDTSTRIGLGWNGPYLKADDSDSSASNVVLDGWGNAFVYNPTGTPPTLVSLGADRAVGGTGDNADITMEMPINMRLATVHGFITQGGTQWSGNATIELNAPNGSGVLLQTPTAIVAADNGHFSFANVPMGVRSATVYIPNKAAPTTTIGPVLFTVDQPYTLIGVNLFDLSPTGPTNLEVPIEMVDYGLSSAIIGILSTFERSRTSLTTTDYDGAVTYSFEVIATNSSITAQPVTIINSAGATLATINIPVNTNTPTRLRVAFTPTAGSDNYRVQFPLTVLANQLSIYTARIIVNQTGATKTSVYVPLLSSNVASVNNTDLVGVDSTNSTAYTQATPIYYSIWKKEDSLLSLATGTPFTLEVVLTGGLLGNATAALFNKNSGLAVTGGSVTSTGITYSLQQATFADNATNFADATEYELRLKTSSILQSASVAKAGLWIRLANLGKGQVFYRIARAYTGTASPSFDGQRAWIDTGNFSNPTVFAEAVASSSSATGSAFFISDTGTAESGTAGTNVTGSGLTWGTAKSRQRSSAVNITAGDRFIGAAQTTAGQTSNLTHQTVMIQFHY